MEKEVLQFESRRLDDARMNDRSSQTCNLSLPVNAEVPVCEYEEENTQIYQEGHNASFTSVDVEESPHQEEKEEYLPVSNVPLSVPSEEERRKRLMNMLHSLATRVPKIILPRIEVLLPRLNKYSGWRVKIYEDYIISGLTCTLCLKHCAMIGAKKNVNRLSSGNDSLLCAACNKSFSSKPSLQRHRDSIHLNVFRYSCSDCGRRFKRSDNLRDHTKLRACWQSCACGLKFRKHHCYESHIRECPLKIKEGTP